MPDNRHPHEQLEELLTPELQKWARMIDRELPDGWGFGLLVFPFETNTVLWTSSAVRESMVDAVETLGRKWRNELAKDAKAGG